MASSRLKCVPHCDIRMYLKPSNHGCVNDRFVKNLLPQGARVKAHFCVVTADFVCENSLLFVYIMTHILYSG